MAYRTTKQNVASAFDFWVKAVGGHKAKSWDDVGGYRLDYAACYGGYNVEQVMSKSGGVCHPITDKRMNARQMYDTLWFATRSIQQVDAEIVDLIVDLTGRLDRMLNRTIKLTQGYREEESQ